MEFSWDFGTGKISDNSTAPEPTFIFPKAGTYKVKLTEKTLPYGFPSYDSATITVDAIPTVAFTKTNACEGYALDFVNQTIGSGINFTWTFGDGSFVTTRDASHKYAAPGAYDVTLAGSQNGCVAKSTQKAYQFYKPKSLWSVASGKCDNDNITFKNSSTITTGIAGDYWIFGDGSISTENEPSHIFGNPGTKKVKLITTSEFGCKDSFSNDVVVKESPKVSFKNSKACSLSPTVFSNTTPAVPATIASYLWDFGDGTSSTLSSPTHSWTSLGNKMITLNMSLDNGCKATVSRELTVGIQPKASFTASDVCAGQPVIFDNGTVWTQGDINYTWTYADGNTSADRAPTHVYNVTSTTTYNVTLKASIAGGCSDSISKPITINEGPKTCDFVADPDYSFAFYGMKLQTVNTGGTPTIQPGVTVNWAIETAGSKKGAVVQNDFGKDGEYQITMRATVDATGCECTKSKTVVLNRTATKDLAETGVALYPNPNNGNFNIALNASFGKEVSVQVLTIAGANVKQLQSANTGLLHINAADLANGVYVVRVTSGEKVVTRKITVQH
jgi:PKD repeat protein